SFGFRAVISVTGEFLDKERNATCRNNFYSMLKYSELKQMTDSGIFEVQNHCYNFHHIRNGRVGIKNKPNEDLQQYVQLLKADTIAMQNKIKQMTGKVARCYTYPYGMYSSVTVNALKELGFECMMTCQEGVNFVSKTSSLFYLKRLERSDTKPLSAMLRNL
ncbi:MAG: polysaccharide deacetylase family protein, partial [Clostridia bacterium]